MNLARMLKALAKSGLDVERTADSYRVRLRSEPHAPVAEVLLPRDFPLEEKALKQLAQLTAVRHPAGGCVTRAIATPDFHPGDGGIAIGSVVETEGIVIPAAVGSDINCGMRSMQTDLSMDSFLSRKPAFVAAMKGDYLLGTRDVPLTPKMFSAVFEGGIPALLSAETHNLGVLNRADLQQIGYECARVMFGGSLHGDLRFAPEALIDSSRAFIRDEGLATIGSGNHFCEIQLVDEIFNAYLAHYWGLRKDRIALMIHSGSRNVGRLVGSVWHDKARQLWPQGLAYPESKIFPISEATHGDLVRDYLVAEATAANYGFVNRMLLAELFRTRLHEVYGDNTDCALVYDIPHNITVVENGTYVTRKGACPAYEDTPVIIPGSMGTKSYFLVGTGNDRFIQSASHGAGRATSRFDMRRRDDLGLEGVECITLREERRIEEAPAAYKPIDSVVDAQVQAGLVRRVASFRPILTFKA